MAAQGGFRQLLVLGRGRVAPTALAKAVARLSPVAPAQLARPLLTTACQKARTEKEILEWVRKQEEKGWESKGIYYHDKKADYIAYHNLAFCTIGVLVFGIWAFRYYPDTRRRHWAMREAYMILRERESKGQDPICKDFIDPATIELPSDEELRDRKSSFNQQSLAFGNLAVVIIA